ncbi:MAG TPA: DUF3822 family protein [Mariniphaga anaerophila]|uniref:DUF3822 family protein n=1 Tax=Mariniphaga anaerophila TaxID=1484053 RepID=A0A831LYI0_9BACT|nr:DUF3822 family protein [Mariniphaga anaerophila]
MDSLKTDPKFDINRTEEYKLSIQVSLDGFSFSVIHPGEKQLLALHHSPVPVSSENLLGRRFEEWFGNEGLLKKKFAKIRLHYSSPKITLVPAKFYDYEKQNRLARLVFGNLGVNATRDNYWPGVEGNLVFTIPESLLNVFDQTFPGIVVVHPLSVYNKRILQGKSEGGNVMALYFEKSWFSLMLYEDEQHQVVNSFGTSYPTDVLFYISSVLKQRELSSKNTKLLLAGDVSSDGEIYKMLGQWFNDANFFVPDISYNRELFNESLHRFIPLL